MRIVLWTAITELAIYVLLAIISIRLFKIAVGITLILMAIEALVFKFDTEDGLPTSD